MKRTTWSKRRRKLEALRQVRRIESMEGAVAHRIMTALEAAERELLTGLRLARPLSSFAKMRVATVRRDLKRGFEMIDRLDGVTAGAIKDQLPALGRRSITELANQAQWLNELFDRVADPVHLNVAGILSRGTKRTIPRVKTAAGRYSKNLDKIIRRELTIASLKSETFHEAAQRLEKRIPLRIQQAKNSAERIVRTEMMTAYNTYHTESASELNRTDPGWVMRWDASADSRRCQLCAELDGAIADVTAGKEFRGGIASPPRHANCRCVLAPWRREWGGENSAW